jgi:hypothetical protein
MEIRRRREGIGPDQHVIGRRLLAAMWQLVVSPVQACHYGLDSFFNTRGAIWAVAVLFAVSVAVSALSAWLLPAGGQAALVLSLTNSVPFAVLLSVVHVLATALIITSHNRSAGHGLIRNCSYLFVGDSDDGTGDFGSLALSFAMIVATIALLLAPVHVLLALRGASDGALLLRLAELAWTLILQVILVTAVTDLNALAASQLLIAASVGAWFGTAVIATLIGAPSG